MVDASCSDGQPVLAGHVGATARTWAPVTASVPEARHFVEYALPETCRAEEVTLLVSELASNAVRHAGSAFTVSLRCDGSTVRVEVADGDPRLPVLRRPPVDAVAGRGLLIVDALATRWGVDPTATGKTVWFELACRSAAGDDAS